MRGSSRRSGFTILELLVVIAILCILIALISGIVKHVREEGRKVQCQSNLRQLGMAFYEFASEPEHNARFPRTDWIVDQGYWLELTNPYYKNFDLLMCPSDNNPFSIDMVVNAMYVTVERTPEKGITKGYQPRDAFRGQFVSYRGTCETNPISSGIFGGRVSDYGRPGRTMLLDEANDSATWPAGRQCTRAEYIWASWTFSNPANINWDFNWGGLTRHSGGANWLMGDGSSKWYDAYSAPSHVSYRADGRTSVGYD